VKLVRLDEVVMKASVILSLVVLVTLQVSLSLGGSPVKGKFAGPPLPSGQPYVSMSVTPGELNLGAIPQPGSYDLPATLTLHITATNRENLRLFCRLNDNTCSSVSGQKKKLERGREEVGGKG